jgi:NAD(P)-dependent dehydrogenase (short-subunit alcohol dehydrogenase family)
MKTVVITGATSGIGRATALSLARQGTAIIALGRNDAKGKAFLEALKRAGSDAPTFIRADMGSLAEVRRAAAEISGRCERIDVLINNAGARNHSFQKNADGFELTFAVNHLAPFLLTALLLERVLASPQGRILTLSSGAHGSARVEPTTQWRPDNYDYRQAYAASKLANLFFAYELARRLEGSNATSNAVNPGGVASRFALNNGPVSWLKHIVSHALHRQLRLPDSAGREIADLALSPEWSRTNGKYFVKGKIEKSSERSYNQKESEDLWNFSVPESSLEASIGAVWRIIRPEL